MKKIVALDDTIILRQHKKPEKVGGIIVPGTLDEKQIQGIVVSSGKDAKVVAGEEIICSRYAGGEFEVNGEKLIKISQKDIYCVLIEE